MPSRTQGEEIWERQKGESAQAYGAFSVYRDMGAERSLSKVARQLDKSKTILGRWSSRWGWVERVRQYDSYLDAEARHEAVKKVKEMTARHIRISLQLQQTALKAMASLDDKALTPKDILAFIDKAVTIEKMSRLTEAGVQETVQRGAPSNRNEDDDNSTVKVYLPSNGREDKSGGENE